MTTHTHTRCTCKGNGVVLSQAYKYHLPYSSTQQIFSLLWPKLPTTILSNFSQKPPLATPPINPKPFHTIPHPFYTIKTTQNHPKPLVPLLARKEREGTSCAVPMPKPWECWSVSRCFLSLFLMSKFMHLCFVSMRN